MWFLFDGALMPLHISEGKSLARKIFLGGLGTTLAIHSCRHDASGIAGTLATGEEPLDAHMLQGVVVAQDAHGRRGACLGGDEHSLVGEETVAHAAKGLEALLQAATDGLWQPEVEWTGYQARSVGRLGEVIAQAAVHKVGHTLCRRILPHVALLPAVVLYAFLIMHHAQGTIVRTWRQEGRVDVIGMQFNHHAAVRPS